MLRFLKLTLLLTCCAIGISLLPVRGQQDPEETGLQFRLRESPNAKPTPTPPQAQPASTPLPDAVTRALLSRLPVPKSPAAERKHLVLREKSLPPPRSGKTITETFPAKTNELSADATAAPTLTVTRVAPSGETKLAAHVTISFSQPMVPVTSVETLSAASVPVKLTPQPPGQWRWLGTKTLLFVPETRLPMATEFTLEVSAGTRSAVGGVTTDAQRWTFATPPPTIVKTLPTGNGKTRNPLLFVEFDQRINPDVVLQHIALTANGRSWPLRLATQAEIENDDEVKELTDKAPPAHWLAFRVVTENGAANPLPAAATIEIKLKDKLPSAEGPRVTQAAKSFSFQTYAPLQVRQLTCRERDEKDECLPDSNWELSFNNALADKVTSDQIKIEPTLPGFKLRQSYGGVLFIEGQPRPRTTYQVTLDPALKDVHGQTLGNPVTLPIRVGAMPIRLHVPGNGLVVLDPAGPKRLALYSVNHESLRVRLFAVTPEQYGDFAAAMRARLSDDRNKLTGSFPDIGRRISDTVVPLTAQPDEIVETQIDLRPALPAGPGHALLLVEPTANVTAPYGAQFFATWIQATEIGLDTFSDDMQLLTWATSLKDGKPLPRAQLRVHAEAPGTRPLGATVMTNAEGLASLKLTKEDGRKVLLAQAGNDTAILPDAPGWWNHSASWQARRQESDLRWHTFDDRSLYRPGEEVHVKGWVRRITHGPTGDVRLANGLKKTLSFDVTDSSDNSLAKGTAQINALGGFTLAFKLPPTANLGWATITLTATGPFQRDDLDHTHRFQIQEFRRPEFELAATASEGPHFVGGQAELTAQARYYTGGGLPNAEVKWQVNYQTANFTPPNRSDFTFGKWIPWWESPAYDGGDWQEFDGRTDSNGAHRLRVELDALNPPRPVVVTAMTRVEDVNRQELSAATEFLVHPATLYVGLRSPRLFVQQGEPLVVEAIASDLDGKLIPERELVLRAAFLEWTYEDGEWREKEAEAQSCTVKSANAPVRCQFTTGKGGRYRITARVLDDRERPNESELTLWVAGGQAPAGKTVTSEKVELIANRPRYNPGETAEILVQAPFAGAEGILTLRRDGLVNSERFTIKGTTHTLRIPIKDEFTPNIYVQVDLVGETLRTDEQGQPLAQLPTRPAFAAGELNLQVTTEARRLTVKAEPRDRVLEPGGQTTVAVEVRNAAGNPVSGSDVTLFVVDEAVLALTSYQLRDPRQTFYRERDSEVRERHSRNNLSLADPRQLLSQSTSEITAQKIAELAATNNRQYMLQTEAASTEYVTVSGEAPNAEMRLRKDFNALAFFAASVPTDARGRATVSLKLPDNLTRYRVMAVAAMGENQFGTTESTITARLSLMVRPSAPRFLNFGDRFALPVVVQNQTDKPLTVNVAVRASNALFVSATTNDASHTSAGRRVTVPANDRVEIRFAATTERPGQARFQIAATADKWSDATEIALPVYTPATTEAFATYGEIDGGAIDKSVLAQPVQPPTDVFKEFGGLQITTSSTQLQALTDALLYLVSYPYECAEQISSRILAIAALRDVLQAFNAPGLPNAATLAASVASDLKRLASLQNDQGEFGFWRPPQKNDETWPYLSIHVAHTMARAQQNGFAVPTEMLQRSRDYLEDIEDHLPDDYSAESRFTLRAYALYVRNLLHERDAAAARKLLLEAGAVEQLPLEALGWLLPVLANDAEAQPQVAAIQRHLRNRVAETAATAHFTTSYSDGAHLLLHSDQRTDAVLLEALLTTDPKNELLPKLVRGLLAGRKAGRWESTQENAFVLLALNRYFQTYEKTSPDFVARVWLENSYAGAQTFKGRSTKQHLLNIPMEQLLAGAATQTLTLAKQGAGRLYYRIGLNYALTNLELKPADYGFTVTRSYEAVDDANDVRRLADGSWRIKAGARVRVRLTMVAPARRYHVALVDPLPAGLEALNPALATTGQLPTDEEDETTRNWWLQWFEHQNLRDERVEAFTASLAEGVYTYSYVAKATTPGTFIVPPPKAEEMYHPETFGRGASDRVVIE